MEGDFSGMEGEDREELWNGLNFEQRESNRAQVKNRPYMQELLKILPALLPVKETFQYVKDTTGSLRHWRRERFWMCLRLKSMFGGVISTMGEAM